MANASGLEDVLGLEDEVPAEGTSVSPTPAQSCGGGSGAEQVALDSLQHIRASRAPFGKFKELLGALRQVFGPRSELRPRQVYRKVAKESAYSSARALSWGCELICGLGRALAALDASPPRMLSEAMRSTLGMAKDVA